MTADTLERPQFFAPKCAEQVEILYSDEYCLLVNKPSGLLSVPGRHPANRDCAISRVQETYADALIVHRLDMDTSGVMVLARGKESHRELSRQFQDRETTKEYIAKVAGIVEKDKGVIDLPLRCDWPNRPKQMVDFELGKPAQTRYEVLQKDMFQNLTHLKLIPITGRSHQLRVHCTELGHPILGCRFYGTEETIQAADRLNLHACTLKVKHPKTGKELTGQSTPPF
ncbi:pseudouridine synthase [Parendozoicomonas sp. Alg238-R29]|uniref:pseudouridine synthase n=1 Tax=Parendozoicomonas sp. Alg238-R29 TaxID=2993446 RepID=UPI00248DBC16|nr:pseudouridine synthase [Parendozoicomonas sp. Alg238-R29]